MIDVVYKSKNYEITVSKYFDALRFGNFDCIVFYSFVDVPHFVECCPTTNHRLTFFSEDDYFRLRNEVTSEYITHDSLIRTVMKIMEKCHKRGNSNISKCYSDYVDDQLEMYSVSKQFADKNEEKVIRVNWFCKTYDINQKAFQRIINALHKSGVVVKNCKLVYEIEI